MGFLVSQFLCVLATVGKGVVADEFLKSNGSVSDSSKVKDVLLEEDFCGVYYVGSGDAGAKSDCDALKSQVVPNHKRTLPTLELGDPKSEHVLFFLHGWPDNAALWANQFEDFCGTQNKENSGAKRFYCIAVALWNYHPQFPTLDKSVLLWDKQIDAFKAVLDEMGLISKSGDTISSSSSRDITLVGHDFGAVLGYQFIYRYPNLFQRFIAIDIPDAPTPNGISGPIPPPLKSLESYVQNNIESYLKNDLSILNPADVDGAPCRYCKTFKPRMGWPYYQFIRGARKAGSGTDEWRARLAPDVEPRKWKFDFTPDFPEHIPILFLYAFCNDGTGVGTPTSCVQRAQADTFIDWVNNRGIEVEHGGTTSSKAVRIEADHWLVMRTPSVANKEIAKWLGVYGGDLRVSNAATILEASYPNLKSGVLSANQFLDPEYASYKQPLLCGALLSAFFVATVSLRSLFRRRRGEDEELMSRRRPLSAERSGSE